MKTCFFISPIGSPDSAERAASDKLLKFIIEPVLKRCGFDRPVRADHITQPGVITSQVFTKLWIDDLVVADLTGSNPNVFYELAVRHIARKPCVHMIRKGERLPFDVAPNRTVFFDFDIEEADRAQTELDKSMNPVEVGITEILSLVQDVRAIVGNIQVNVQAAVGIAAVEQFAAAGRVSIDTIRDAVKVVGLEHSGRDPAEQS
jgi:hypothetical protein